MKNYIIKNNNEISYLQFIKLLEYDEIIHHAISLKPIDVGGNQIFNDENDMKQSINNYKKLCKVLNLEYKNIYRPYQTHTNMVKCVKDEKAGIFTQDFINVDGLITNQKNKILSISIADCIDLMFFDPVKRVISNIHSGWQGTYQLICRENVENMVDNYQCNVKDIICCIGPSIRKCHFEVDEDIAKQFYEKFKYLPNIDDIISKGRVDNKKQKYNIDTVLINITELKQLGLKEENIIDCGICTVCNSNKFHSYRVHKELSGRNTGIIALI